MTFPHSIPLRRTTAVDCGNDDAGGWAVVTAAAVNSFIGGDCGGGRIQRGKASECGALRLQKEKADG